MAVWPAPKRLVRGILAAWPVEYQEVINLMTMWPTVTVPPEDHHLEGQNA